MYLRTYNWIIITFTDYQTNTYQCIVATDEIRTYVMFNYEQIQWITHEDNYIGLKGSAAYVN
jgi:hypothetical protein